MTLVGHIRFLRAFAVIAATPQASNLPIGREDARAIDDAGRRRIGDRDFDHVDAEQSGLVTGGIEASGQLLVITDIGCARIVEDDCLVIRRDDRMCVTAATSLDQPDLAGPRDVRNVEDADTAETVFAYFSIDTLEAAIDAGAAVLNAHDQKIADDGNVTLPTRANRGTDKLGHAVIAKSVSVEAVIAACHQEVA